MEFIKRSWRGEEKLWKVFWLYNFIGTIFFSVVIAILTMVATPLVYAASFVHIIFIIWILVSLWKCAWNAKHKIWGYVARIIVVSPLISLVLGAILSGQELIAAAECRLPYRQEAKANGINEKEYVQQHSSEIQACIEKKKASR